MDPGRVTGLRTEELCMGETGRETGRQRILLVDDSNAVRQLLKVLLSMQMSLDIQEASDGLEAARKLKEMDFDLVITDIRMPQMDGLSLIEMVRNEISRDLPIIVVTTLGREADRDEALRLGANSYVTKPVQAPDLIRAMTDLIA